MEATHYQNSLELAILAKMEKWEVEQVVAWAELHKLTAALDPEKIRSNDIDGELLMDLDDEAIFLSFSPWFQCASVRLVCAQIHLHLFISRVLC